MLSKHLIISLGPLIGFFFFYHFTIKILPLRKYSKKCITPTSEACVSSLTLWTAAGRGFTHILRAEPYILLFLPSVPPWLP